MCLRFFSLGCVVKKHALNKTTAELDECNSDFCCM